MLINIINYLTIYRAYIAHQKEAIYGLSEESNFFHKLLNMEEAIYGLSDESNFFHKFTKYGLISTLQGLDNMQVESLTLLTT